MQAARLTAAVMLSTVVGGSALYFMLFFAGGGDFGDLRNVTLLSYLTMVWVIIGVVVVLPLVVMYGFAKNAMQWRLFMAFAWVPLAVLANFLVRGEGAKPIGETVHIIAAITGGIVVINFIFWMIARHRGNSGQLH